MATRAEVTQSVFSEIFSTVEESYRAAFEQGPDRLSHTVTEAKPSSRDEELARNPGAARAKALSRAAALPIRATHRTTLVLRAIARAPYSNNREVAQAAGLVDEGQTSKLLARLERQGAIENVGIGAARGEPNAWLLTAEGQRIVELLAERGTERPPRRASTRVRGAR